MPRSTQHEVTSGTPTDQKGGIRVCEPVDKADDYINGRYVEKGGIWGGIWGGEFFDHVDWKEKSTSLA